VTGLRAAAILLPLLILTLIVAAPSLAPFDPLDQNLGALNRPPGPVHLLGTDHLGRDVLSRLLSGAGTTLAVALGGAALALAVGAGLGVLATAAGRWPETAAFGVLDTLRGLPPTLLALVTVAALGGGLLPLLLALAASYAPMFAHVARVSWRREAAEDYVAAALVCGAGPARMLYRHILPNLAGPLITLVAIAVPRCIVTESVLSFLGLGAAPDAPTWGRMAADATRLAEVAPHALLAPVAAITLATAAAAVAGDRLRRRADPFRGSR
jgi:ABC-type dipeptide/oligopeptide/nickel transport system permease subunit